MLFYLKQMNIKWVFPIYSNIHTRVDRQNQWHYQETFTATNQHTSRGDGVSIISPNLTSAEATCQCQGTEEYEHLINKLTMAGIGQNWNLVPNLRCFDNLAILMSVCRCLNTQTRLAIQALLTCLENKSNIYSIRDTSVILL